jgi:hypothetical protein
MSFENKMVAVLNEKIESGVIMNALAHMCMGFGSIIGQENLRLTNYQDANDELHPHISEMPFMILKANSNKIKKLKAEALAAGIKCVNFTDTMTVGTYLEQIEKTKNTKNEDLIYYGVVLFGDWAKVSELTRKFSLWR